MPEKKETFYMTISPNPKRIHSQIAYVALQDIRQKHRIMHAINHVHRWCSLDIIISDIHFEYNKRLMVHAHFEMKCSVRQLSKIQKMLNAELGSSRLAPEIAIHFCPAEQWIPKTNVDTGKVFESWTEYCNKEDILPPENVRCMCVNCKYTREDRNICKKVEFGEITLTMGDSEDCEQQ